MAENTPTQVTHPWKAALRTGIQTFLGVAAVAVIALPYVSEFVAEQWPSSPVVGWIAVAGGFIGSLSALASRIMAIPAVNEFLTRLGIGAQPKR